MKFSLAINNYCFKKKMTDIDGDDKWNWHRHQVVLELFMDMSRWMDEELEIINNELIFIFFSISNHHQYKNQHQLLSIFLVSRRMTVTKYEWLILLSISLLTVILLFLSTLPYKFTKMMMMMTRSVNEWWSEWHFCVWHVTAT